MILKDNKYILNGVLIFSILSLSIAYFIQYVLGHQPCNLCLIERIPYIASVILISLIFIINKFEKIISIILLLFIQLFSISFTQFNIHLFSNNWKFIKIIEFWYSLYENDSSKYFEPYYLHIDRLFKIVLTLYYFCDQRSIIWTGC